MSMPAQWRELLGFGFFCQSGIYRLQARLGKFKARLSSDRSEREAQKSWTRSWGSLAQVGRAGYHCLQYYNNFKLSMPKLWRPKNMIYKYDLANFAPWMMLVGFFAMGTRAMLPSARWLCTRRQCCSSHIKLSSGMSACIVTIKATDKLYYTAHFVLPDC